MQNYLEWLTNETPTKWWHDSAIPQEIDQAIEWGALGVTTNPVLTYKTFQAVPDFWQSEIDKIPADLPLDMRAEALLKIVAQYAAKKFLPVYDKTQGRHGYALGQLNPAICSSSEKMLEQALRYVSWGENIAVKLPTVKAALPVVEELAARGVAVCTTLNFSVAQALAVASAYERGVVRAQAADITVKPCFVVQQGGRLDDYLIEVAQDNGIDVTLDDLHEAGNAVCKKSYALYRQRGYRATIMPAGLRGVHHLAALAGGDMVFSLQSRVQKMVLAAALPKRERIMETVDQKTLSALSRIPEFVRAYATDGMQPEEFISFGVTQKTLSQFLWTGWAPLETYGSALQSDRWF